MSGKRILILCPGYNDNDANFICAKKIADTLVFRDHIVDFYCLKKSADLKDTTGGKTNVYFFDNAFTDIKNHMEKKGKPIETLSFFGKLSIKILQNLKSLRYPQTGIKYWDSMKRKPIFKRIGIEWQKKPYDIVISVVQPFGFAVLASEIKKKYPSIKWITYMLDPFVYNYTFPSNKLKKRKKDFLKYTQACDGFIFTRGIYDETKHRDKKFDKPHCIVDLPNLCEREVIETRNYQDKIELLFAGMFYSDIRNPRAMFSVLSKIIENHMVVTLMSKGCSAEVQSFADAFKENVVRKDIVPHDECLRYSDGADFLLNLGNTIPNQLPSKVFEYISSGKPVVNFYFNEDDAGLYYFRNYPLAFNFNVQNITDKTICELKTFIRNNIGKRISFEKATEKMTEARSGNVCDTVAEFVLEQ